MKTKKSVSRNSLFVTRFPLKDFQISRFTSYELRFTVIYLLFSVFCVLSFASCGGGGEKTPATPSGYGEINISVDLSGALQKNKKNLLPTISKVVASVSASDLDTQTKNLTSGGNGIWTGTMQVRVGKSRTFTVEAYETNNIVVYRNCGAVITDIVEGTNTVKVQLCDVSGSISINGKTIYTLVWNIDSSCDASFNDRIPLAIDSTNIYFIEMGSATNCSNATLKKIPIASGAITVLATSLNWPEDVETDGTEVFWIERGSNTIKKVAVGGGAVTTIASALNLSGPSFLALAGTDVYFNEYTGGTMKKVAKTGGAVTTLASVLSAPQNVETDGTDVFFTDSVNSDAIKSVPVAGGAVTTLISGTATRWPISLAGTNVYYNKCSGLSVCTSGNSIVKIAKSGGAETVLVSGGLLASGDVVSDGTDVYFSEIGSSPNYTDGVLKKVAITGGTVTNLTNPCPVYRPNSKILGDATNIYWIEWGTSTNGWTDGVLRKMAK